MNVVLVFIINNTLDEQQEIYNTTYLNINQSRQNYLINVTQKQLRTS